MPWCHILSNLRRIVAPQINFLSLLNAYILVSLSEQPRRLSWVALLNIFPENWAAAGWEAPHSLGMGGMDMICLINPVIFYILLTVCLYITHLIFTANLWYLLKLVLLDLHLCIYFTLFWGAVQMVLHLKFIFPYTYCWHIEI